MQIETDWSTGMTDVLTAAQRRLNMSRIKSADTKPEKVLRAALHARGLRFRLHRRDLPGCPDVVFARDRAVVFVHGCFWHGHEDCSYAKLPATRAMFWKTKLATNRLRDRNVIQELRAMAWRVAVVWECALRGPHRPLIDGICGDLREFLRDPAVNFLEIRSSRKRRIK
jgi:DNA mismatch endonuclease, patch repair protein